MKAETETLTRSRNARQASGDSRAHGPVGALAVSPNTPLQIDVAAAAALALYVVPAGGSSQPTVTDTVGTCGVLKA